MLRFLARLPLAAALTAVFACALAAAPAAAGLLPIYLDGWFDDWAGQAPVYTDASGDGGTVDWGAVWVANDQDYLYIRFETGGEVQPDEQQQMRLYLDADMNAGTGASFGGIGAELVWEFGFRDGNNGSLNHDDIGLLMGPTVSSTEFEIALKRTASVFGGGMTDGSQVRFILRDADQGDLAPSSGSITYTLAAGSDAPATLATARADAGHIRLATWNVQNDGLFDGGSAEAAQGRLLDVMDPDVLVINEAWNHSANQVRDMIASHLPGTWYAVGIDGGNVIVSRYPILDSWEVNPGYRITAALLDLPAPATTDLLVIGCHWRCCTADTDRQNEADSIIEFLADARSPGGVISLPADTPFILGGDLNLVGWQRQLTTLITGDIFYNGTYGPDSPPDWDGSDFDIVLPRQVDGRAGYTWRNDFSSYYPGLLDWICYSGSALTLHNNFILETRTMEPATLSALGLFSGDTFTASDHTPRVADFSLGTYVSGVPGAGASVGAARLLPNMPNPFNPATELRFELAAPGRAELAVYDLRGRLVRSFAAAPYPAGVQSVMWDGRGDDGRPAPSGVYNVMLRAKVDGATIERTQSVVLVE